MSLTSLYESGVATTAFVWLITRNDGTRVGFTDHDQDITFQSVLCHASTGMTTTRVSKSLFLEAGELEVEGAIDGSILTKADIDRGLYDNASAELYNVNWKNVSEFELIILGNFGQIVLGDQGGFSTEFLSKSSTLDQTQGRTFQRTCNWKLGDSKCGIDLTSSLYRTSTSVSSANGVIINVADLSSYDDDWFTLGKLILNDVYELDIRKHVGNTLSVWRRPRIEVTPGMTAVVVAGCKQSSDVCATKFANIDNFGGFPFVPGTDRLTIYPVRGEQEYNGESLIREFDR